MISAALTAALGGWALVFFFRDRAVILRQLIAAGVVEAALIAQAVVAGVLQATGARVSDSVTLWSYLVFVLFVPPAVGVVALVERTKWSSMVLAVATWAIVAMQVRIWQVWTA